MWELAFSGPKCPYQAKKLNLAVHPSILCERDPVSLHVFASLLFQTAYIRSRLVRHGSGRLPKFAYSPVQVLC